MDHPDLFALLNGELDNADVVSTGRHLATCDSCRTELAEAVVGHALLIRAARTLDELHPEAPLPPLALPRRRASGRVLAALAATAAAVAVGVTATVVVVGARDEPPSVSPTSPSATPTAFASAVLRPVADDASGVHGELDMYRQDPARTRVQIRTAGLGPAPTGEFYYAWLLDPSTLKMLPLGQIDSHGGSFDLADEMVGAYSAVDISLEDDDGDPAHSATSVLRGRY